MTGGQAFVDHYSVLQVASDCDPKALEHAYRHLLKMHHPDHSGTADTTKFDAVVAAYKILRNAGRRAEYDILYRENVCEERVEFRSDDGAVVDESAALGDADDHARILMFLYKKRRENAQDAGVIGFYLQQLLNCSDEHFEFHKWYLKEKGYIVVTEQGTLAITIQGIDHVISISRTTRAEKLLIGQLKDAEG